MQTQKYAERIQGLGRVLEGSGVGMGVRTLALCFFYGLLGGRGLGGGGGNGGGFIVIDSNFNSLVKREKYSLGSCRVCSVAFVDTDRNNTKGSMKGICTYTHTHM